MFVCFFNLEDHLLCFTVNIFDHMNQWFPHISTEELQSFMYMNESTRYKTNSLICSSCGCGDIYVPGDLDMLAFESDIYLIYLVL